MATKRLRVGFSANIYQPDFSRMAYKGRRLLYLEEGMAHWVMKAGAFACLLPTVPDVADATSVEDLVAELDAVIITGGADMAPESYGEKPLRPDWSGDKHRDDYEIAIIRAALKLDKPLLGICRGHQVLNVAMGGTLYQDVRTQVSNSLHHRIYDVYEGNHHEVHLEAGGELARLFGVQKGHINSVHHQAVKDLAPGMVVEARCPHDGVVEAIRLKDGSGAFMIGLQWHPELQHKHESTLLSPEPVLQALLQAARTRKD
ncbi:MAG: gamma-glutamyl-gamma-aminobutyrate hydrolase family protein [Deltaproteobacteria bacterium]|nr:gamma-glutamyl-gamma-aminobutyrate hydrolase family protein [Deltaproteobacteria bacterium]